MGNSQSFSSNELAGAVSGAIPATSYSIDPTDTALLGFDALYSVFPPPDQYNTMATPFLYSPEQSSLPCNPITINAAQSIDCPIAKGDMQIDPGLWTISFSRYSSVYDVGCGCAAIDGDVSETEISTVFSILTSGIADVTPAPTIFPSSTVFVTVYGTTITVTSTWSSTLSGINPCTTTVPCITANSDSPSTSGHAEVPTPASDVSSLSVTNSESTAQTTRIDGVAVSTISIPSPSLPIDPKLPPSSSTIIPNLPPSNQSPSTTNTFNPLSTPLPPTCILLYKTTLIETYIPFGSWGLAPTPTRSPLEKREPPGEFGPPGYTYSIGEYVETVTITTTTTETVVFVTGTVFEATVTKPVPTYWEGVATVTNSVESSVVVVNETSTVDGRSVGWVTVLGTGC
ncbi:uncharacterized protein PAC_08673 [Phialocephala subalpina]|uniref:Uncharacterized protein n=1 Tax=Phialocephala subalpina TaxID=576137 RepID=A0A1L7X185_9HELO|nr:uncharacterized protein PAC_08673 [Phialocephala subalpina]